MMVPNTILLLFLSTSAADLWRSQESQPSLREMDRVAENSALKRKRPDPKAPTQKLSDADSGVYEVIRGKKEAGISKGYLRAETKLAVPVINKSIKSLLTKNLIKVVPNIQESRRGQAHYMAIGFEPSTKLTGGMWYAEGKLDTEFIQILKDQCIKHTRKLKLATVEGISHSIRKSGVFKIDCSIQQIGEIVQSLVLDNELVELSSTATGGSKCYRCSSKGEAPKTEAITSIPCGVCPRLNDCTPDGIISPNNCLYYIKWLDF